MSNPPPVGAGGRPKRQRVGKRIAEGAGEPVGVTFNPLDKASFVQLSRDRRTATCAKGYRMLRATTSVSSGAWYCEFTICHDSKPGSHFRLGWANECGEAHGPVGYDQHSYAFRDIGGVRVHQSIRSEYGRAFGPGDVIGCLIDFATPPGELALAEARDDGASAGPADGVRQLRAQAAATGGADREAIEALLYSTTPPQRPPPPPTAQGAGAGAGEVAEVEAMTDAGAAAAAAGSRVGYGRGGAGAQTASAPGDGPPNGKHSVNRRYWGSTIRFFVNGEDCGPAFVHLTREARYFPAASMYAGGAVRFNPGPTFAFAPADEGSFPRAPKEGSSGAKGVADLKVGGVAGSGGGAGGIASGSGASAAVAAVAAAAVAPAGEEAGAGVGAGAGAGAGAPSPPRCSPWRPMSEAEGKDVGGAGAALKAAVTAAAAVASSTLAGSALLRLSGGGAVASYNFAGTKDGAAFLKARGREGAGAAGAPTGAPAVTAVAAKRPR